MLTRVRLGGQEGSAMVTALLVMLIVLPLGLALLSIVDTQARESRSERTRDRAFNLADSALSSAAVSLGRSAWPASGATAPSNLGPTGTAAACGTAPFGATLGAATNVNSATSKLQPNLNASYDDSAYTGATWQINVCDDDTNPAAGPTVWKDALLSGQNYDVNNNRLMWVRAEATVAGRRRVLAARVSVKQVSALSSRFGLITGRMNAEVTNSLGAILGGPLTNDLVTSLLGTAPLVAADPLYPATVPATTGVIGVRCGALDGCLTGVLAAASSLPVLGTLITGGKLVQATSPTATSEAAIAQFKQQAIASGTYVASSPGSASSTSPPLCTIPAGANANTIVYIEQVGTTGAAGTVGGPGDQYCRLDVTTNPTFKALVIGRGRVVLRGNNTANGGTFNGFLYALNQQRDTLGDAATPTREVIRIDKGAHVRGGVAADGKSAQVSVYPPPSCTPGFLGLGCLLSAITSILGALEDYNPAIQADVAKINALKIYDTSALEPSTYRDISGERR